MRRFPTRALAVAAVPIVVALLAGCGGGGGGSSTTTSETSTSSTETTATTNTESLTDWANGFCSAFGSWSTTMTAIGKDLQQTPTKDNLQSAGDDVKSANETLANQLKGLGKPDIERGGEAKNVIDQLATQIGAASDKITSALQNLSTVTELATAATAVSAALVTLQTQVNDAVSQLKSIAEDKKGSLKDALKNASSCKALANGS